MDQTVWVGIRAAALKRWAKREDAKVAGPVRAELEHSLLKNVRWLLKIALSGQDSAEKQWAGQLLARIGAGIEKCDKKPSRKLSKTNPVYREKKAELGKLRVDVLFPKPVGKAVQLELDIAERYRSELICAKALHILPMAKKAIPKEYWPVMELPEFSVRSKQRWWKFLWPLIKKNSPDLLAKLRDSVYKRAEHNPYWRSYRKQFRQHLGTLARWRECEGTLIP